MGTASTPFRTMFASLFLCASFVIFLWPMVSSFHISMDRNMQQWFGHYMLSSLSLPILFLCVYAWHVRAGKPVTSAIAFSLLFPCALFFSLGMILHLQGNWLVDTLKNPDYCPTKGSVGEMEFSWQQATNFYSCCQVKMGNSKFVDLCEDPLVKLPEKTNDDMTPVILQSCPGYYEETVRNPSSSNWPYLQYLEANYGCKGFCKTGPSLFVHNEGYSRDTCGNVLKVVADTKLSYSGLVMCVYSAVVALLFGIWMIVVNRPLRDMQNRSLLLDGQSYTYDVQ